MDCGADGQVLTHITTTSPPTGIHQESFQLIADRWQIIWPEFRRLIAELIESYEQDAPDWKRVRTLYVHIPDETLGEDAEWGIDVVFFSSDTLWSLPYSGWTAVPGRAQAMW
jgi:hypothetical protein